MSLQSNFNLVKNFLIKNKEYVGYLSTIVGFLSFRSVLETIYKTRKTNNFPYEALILTIFGWLLMSFYGFLKGSIPSILLGLVYTSIFGYILYVKITEDLKHHKLSK